MKNKDSLKIEIESLSDYEISDEFLDYSKIRTARKKRQNYLKDYHKCLFRLADRERKLWKLERELPVVPLER